MTGLAIMAKAGAADFMRHPSQLSRDGAGPAGNHGPAGYDNFFVAGHDRGGRTVHRMFMDHPERIHKVCLMDIIPNHYVWNNTTKAWAVGTWHWGFIAQPEPFPERIHAALVRFSPTDYFYN